MKSYSIIISAILLTVSTVACKKSTHEEEIVTATITINKPVVNDTIAYGDTLKLSAIVNGSAEMHGYSVTFTNATTGFPVYAKAYDEHASSYTLSEAWKNNVTAVSTINIVIDVVKDHDNNHEIKTMNVVCLN
jgi:hypothetical protein